MRAAIVGVGQVLGWTALLFVLSGCPKVTTGDEDDDTDESEGGSGVGGESGASGEGGAAGTGGEPGTGGTSGEGGRGGDPGSAGGEGGAGGGQEQDAGPPDDQPGCDLVCEEFQHCELVEVTCIQAPCPPNPECVDNAFCGGIAGFTCEGAAVCEDDPRDDCDPENGGADCGGVCMCKVLGRCAEGAHWDLGACACVNDEGDGAGEGEPCGPNTCTGGQVCCNESCGICAPPEGACTQQFCG